MLAASMSSGSLTPGAPASGHNKSLGRTYTLYQGMFEQIRIFNRKQVNIIQRTVADGFPEALFKQLMLIVTVNTYLGLITLPRLSPIMVIGVTLFYLLNFHRESFRSLAKLTAG